MNLCIVRLTYICIISCVIALPSALGENTTIDKENKTNSDTILQGVSTVAATDLTDNSTTTTEKPTTTSSTTDKTTTAPTSTETSTTNKPTTPTTPSTTSSTTTAKPSTSTTVAPSTTSTTPQPPQPCHRFDGPSFIGGTVLSMGLLAISFICYKFYKARNERNYHTL